MSIFSCNFGTAAQMVAWFFLSYADDNCILLMLIIFLLGMKTSMRYSLKNSGPATLGATATFQVLNASNGRINSVKDVHISDNLR